MTHAQSHRGQTISAFILVTLIWGSTWFVIRDQLAHVPAAWNVAWRFLLASLGMVALAKVRGDSLRLPAGGQRLAFLVGLTQFCGNYEFVYQAERHLTSGVVAVIIALLLVPNALFSALFLGTKLTRRFLAGSAVAIAGIALLLAHEAQIAPAGNAVLLGVALSVAAMLSASIANVLQAGDVARRTGGVPLMAWSMIWGALIDTAYALATAGPPVIDPRPAWFLGTAYLAIVGSVVTFPLYFLLIRRMGAGPAAYNSVATPVIAMALSTLFEGYVWGTLAIAGSLLALTGMVIALGGRR
ncbi:MAG: EamA family transporter [Sphingomonadales bacterium]|nr:EamA family transporter [Sphingomonadales bacterium]